MNFRKAPLVAVAVAAALVFSGCAILEEFEPEETTEPPTVIQEFRVAPMNEEGIFTLIAGDGEKQTTVELNGTFQKVGQCLGVTGTEQGDLTVVWPVDTVTLQQKTSIEFPSNDWEGDPVRTRLNLSNPVIISGDFVTDATWFGQIPEGCAVPEVGVFVISNAHHPAPPVEEDPEEGSEEEEDA